MAVVNTIKTTDFAVMILHGADTLNDIGTAATEGTAAYFLITGVQPYDEPVGEGKVKLGNIFVGNKAYWRYYNVTFAPFKVETSDYYNDYNDYQHLMTILKSNFVGIIDISLERGTAFWDTEFDGEPIIVEVADMSAPTPDFENGYEELTLTFRKRINV